MNKSTENLKEAWKKRADYKGYDRTKGSSYNTWRSIIYGNKGKKIGFPLSWRSFDNFIDDVGSDWERGKLLVRYDSSKPYSKENCFWVEKGFENFTKLSKLEYNGEEKTLVEWVNIFNLNYSGVRQRYFRGKNYTNEEILFGKTKKNRRAIKDISKYGTQGQRDKVSKMLSSYRLKDKKKGFEICDLTIEEGISLIKEPCIYCGDLELIGLDRIDNNIGHIKSNVVPCCYTCNTARNDNFSFNEMKLLGETIKKIKEQRNEN